MWCHFNFPATQYLFMRYICTHIIVLLQVLHYYMLTRSSFYAMWKWKPTFPSMELWTVEYVHENCFSRWLPVPLYLNFPKLRYCLVFSSPLKNTWENLWHTNWKTFLAPKRWGLLLSFYSCSSLMLSGAKAEGRIYIYPKNAQQKWT